MKFWFYNIAPTKGMFLNGLFFPSNRPSPIWFFFFLFFLPLPSEVPINGGDLPILGAAPPLLPILTADPPFKASITSGIPTGQN